MMLAKCVKGIGKTAESTNGKITHKMAGTQPKLRQIRTIKIHFAILKPKQAHTNPVT